MSKSEIKSRPNHDHPKELAMTDDLKLDATFNLRYAMRVLERNASYWRKVATLLKFLSILGGSLALAGVLADKPKAAIWMGLLFAIAQALENALSPIEKALLSEVQRKQYARLWAGHAQSDASALSSAYMALVAEDEICPARSLRELAYDDVVIEQGLDPASCYGGNRLMRLLS